MPVPAGPIPITMSLVLMAVTLLPGRRPLPPGYGAYLQVPVEIALMARPEAGL